MQMTSFKTWLITAGCAGIGSLLGAAGGNFLQEPEFASSILAGAGTVIGAIFGILVCKKRA